MDVYNKHSMTQANKIENFVTKIEIPPLSDPNNQTFENLISISKLVL